MRTLILLFAFSVVGTFSMVCYENKPGFINDRKVSKTTVAKILKTIDEFGLPEYLKAYYMNSYLDKNNADEIKSCSTCAVIRAQKGRIQLCWTKSFEDCKAMAYRGFSCCEKDECNKLDLKELYCYQSTFRLYSRITKGPPVSEIEYKHFQDILGPIKSRTGLPKAENDNFALPCDQCVSITFSDPKQNSLALCAYNMTPGFCDLGLEKCNNTDCQATCCKKSGCNSLEKRSDGSHSPWCHHDVLTYLNPGAEGSPKSFQAGSVSADEAFGIMETVAPELANDNDVIELKKSDASYECEACATLSKAGKTVAFCMPGVIVDKGFCDKDGFKCCKEDFCNYKTKEGTGQMADGDDGGGNHSGNLVVVNLVFILFSFSTAFFPLLFPISIIPY